MRKLNLLILVLISSFTAMRAVTSEKDLWQLHTSDIHVDYVGAPMANGGIGLLPLERAFFHSIIFYRISEKRRNLFFCIGRCHLFQA